MSAINRVVLSGGLTRDPELRHTPDGTSVVTLRLGFTTVHLLEGEWRERSNYIDVETWGTQAENAAKYLTRGRQIAVDGRLQWSEYETNGRKRQVHRIVAENLQYMPPPSGGGKDSSAVQDGASEPVKRRFRAAAMTSHSEEGDGATANVGRGWS